MATFGGTGRTGIADVRTVDTSDPRNDVKYRFVLDIAPL